MTTDDEVSILTFAYQNVLEMSTERSTDVVVK